MRQPPHVVLTLLLVLVVLPASAGAQGTETVVYFHTDAVGSVRLTTDATGQVLERYDYGPFGEPWPATPAQPEAVRFGGNERDTETMLSYFSARYLASEAGGRFTTVDPGHVGGDIFDSQSWNAYAYARNNPLRFVDPFGTDYEIRIIGGEGFVFQGSWADLHRFAPGFTFGNSTWSGDIKNADGTKVGTYWWIPSKDIFAEVIRGVSDGGWQSQIARIPRDQVMGASPFMPPIGRATALVSEAASLVARAALTVSKRGAVASSEAVALRAAEQWVGIGARPIRDRVTGQIVGKISVDGQRLYRTTSIDKAQPYVNLESKTTGGNFHIRW